MEYIKFVNQSRFQGFCGPIKISGVHKLKILQFWDFYLFSSIFFTICSQNDTLEPYYLSNQLVFLNYL